MVIKMSERTDTRIVNRQCVVVIVAFVVAVHVLHHFGETLIYTGAILYQMNGLKQCIESMRNRFNDIR